MKRAEAQRAKSKWAAIISKADLVSICAQLVCAEQPLHSVHDHVVCIVVLHHRLLLLLGLLQVLQLPGPQALVFWHWVCAVSRWPVVGQVLRWRVPHRDHAPTPVAVLHTHTCQRLQMRR